LGFYPYGVGAGTWAEIYTGFIGGIMARQDWFRRRLWRLTYGVVGGITLKDYHNWGRYPRGAPKKKSPAQVDPEWERSLEMLNSLPEFQG